MSNTPRFSDQHVEFIKKRAYEGASNNNIATELNHDATDEYFSGNDVGILRESLRLPAPNVAAALAAAVLPSAIEKSAPSPVVEEMAAETTSAETVIKRRGRGPAKGHNKPENEKTRNEKPAKETLKAVFSLIPDEIVAKVKALKDEGRKNSDVNFTPVPVKKFKAGKTYYYPGIGPVLCGEEKDQILGGFPMKIAALKDIHGHTNTNLYALPKRNIRELADKKTMDDVLYRLISGKAEMKFPKIPPQLLPFLNEKLKSDDIGVITNLAGEALRRKNVAYFDKAVKLLASEYATVNGTTMKFATELFNHAAQRPTLEDMRKPEKTTQPIVEEAAAAPAPDAP